jgi:CheY-like chemotaxis protein
MSENKSSEMENVTSIPPGPAPVVVAVGTVLLVDDAEELQDALQETLRNAGYAVVAARNGREAFDYLLANPAPDVVLLDLQMPVMTGWELLRLLRSYWRLDQIPVVIISAGERLATIQSEHTLCLQKPIDAEKLLEVVRSLLKRH